MKKYFATVLVSLVIMNVLILLPLSQVLAQSTRTTPAPTSTNGRSVEDGLKSIETSFPETVVSKDPSPTAFAKKLIDYALYLSALLAVVFIIIGGYMYIFSAGNDDRAKTGRKTMTNALIGLILIILSYVIVQVVYRFLTDTP